jgi:dephospho-CoA kinase
VRTIAAEKEMLPIRIGLTGSIGMGKSTITKQCRRLGFPVFDADEIVHQIYSVNGEAVEPIRRLFPSAIVDNAVSRPQLTKIILSNASTLPEIERIVHPIVISKRKAFTDKARDNQSLFVIYDIPLLFEKFAEYEKEVDYIVVLSCDAKIQEERVLRRPGMTSEKFQAILSKQLPDSYKRDHAHYIINTGFPGYVEGKHQLATIFEDILMTKEVSRFDDWKNRKNDSLPLSVEQTPKEARNLSALYDLIIFDMDDTLCACVPTLMTATKDMINEIKAKMPNTFAKHKENLNEVMKTEIAR